MLETGRTWGTTLAERSVRYPCEDLVPDGFVVHRAVDVHAPAEVVFRWLCQLRVAPYSYDWIDNFGRRSPRTLTPGLEQVAVGQRCMTWFRIAALEPDRSLTAVVGKGPRCALTYQVSEGRLLGVMATCWPRWLEEPLVWGDLVMMRKQLRTLARLAEQTARG